MVLSPDSEFFQYFKADTANGTLPKPAAPDGIAPLPITPSVPTPSDVLPPDNVRQPVDFDEVTNAPVSIDQATPSPTGEPTGSSAQPAVDENGDVVPPSIESSVSSEQ
jgi:hypothetical protein